MLKISMYQLLACFLLIIFITIIGLNGFFNYTLLGYISAIFFNIILFFSLVFLKNKPVFLFLMVLYALMFNLSILVDQDLLYLNNISHNIFPYIILPFFCFLLIFPLIFLRRPNLDYIINNDRTLLFIILLCPPILISFFYLLPFTINTFTYGAKDIRSSLADGGILPQNFLTTFSVGISMFYPLFIFLFFYGLIKKINKIIIFILFIGIIDGFVGGLIFAARDRFIWIPLFIFINIWLWQPYLSKSLKSNLKIYLTVFSIISIIFLISFTINRFSDSQTGVLGSILIYFGAQPYIFAETVESHTGFYGLDLRFPLFLQILGLHVNDITRDIPYQWMFGTLFSDYYMMGGWLYCILLIVFTNIIFIYIYNYKANNPWLYILFFIMHLQILMQGIFYFSLGFSGGNFYILLTVLLAIFLNIFYRLKVKL